MMSAAKGHFNGTDIVLDEKISLGIGQSVIVIVTEEKADVTEKKKYDLSKYIGHGEKRMLDRDAAEVIREERDNGYMIGTS